MQLNEEALYQVALTKISKVGPINGKILISHCGSARQVFTSSNKVLLKIPGIGEMVAKEFANTDAVLAAAEEEIEFCIKKEVKILCYMDEEYPRRLKHFDYSPIVLYYKGNGNLNTERTIGVVGTRTPTDHGRIKAEQIIADLANLGVTTVSGLAFGVDSIAHRKSLEYNIPTIGVMGCGLHLVYPSEHRELAAKMMENGGLLTEFGKDTKPDRVNFPMRNRVIAALSDAVLVVESKKKGGSMITADFANQYNKDVFAIPGRPSDELSQGCNMLIKSSRAHLLDSVEDLKYIMRWEGQDAKKPIQASLFLDLSDGEQRVLDSIKENKQISIDELGYMHQTTSSEMASMLLSLEFKGLVRSIPGKRYLSTF